MDSGSYQMMDENDYTKRDYFPGSDLFDAFCDSDTESTTSSYSSSSLDEEGNVVVKKPVIVPNKTPRHASLMEYHLDQQQQHQEEEEEESSGWDEESDKSVEKAQPIAGKMPFFKRMTRLYKLRIMQILQKKRRLEEERRVFEKEVSQCWMKFAQLNENLPITPLLVNTNPEKLQLILNTNFLDYSRLAPLLFQNLLSFEIFTEELYRRILVKSSDSTVINICIKI